MNNEMLNYLAQLEEESSSSSGGGGGGGEARLISKTFNANGTYRAAGDNADGYSTVTVNVAYPSANGVSF